VNSDFWAGRIRWEQEVHIFPPLLLLHPRSANLMIQSRLKQLGEAVDNAKLSATSEFEYAGAKYPYGTITGSELWQQNGNLTDFSRALYTR
jgi:trehalose/maltose hydrolase-like predicted phosphorylase